jgi:anti-sigma factor RsiW
MSAHLSAHQLEQHQLELLQGPAASEVKSHLATCADCTAKAAELASFESAFRAEPQRAPDVFARRVLARVERRAAERKPRLSWGWLTGMLVPAAAMAALLLLHVRSGNDGYVGVKGGARLTLQSRSGALSDGAHVHAGDELRFVVGAPAAAQVLVLGLNEKGELFPYYPLQGERSVPIAAGQGVAVPGSVVLDAQPGRERFYVLLSETPISVATVQEAVRAGHVTLDAPTLPIQASQASVLVQKER